MYNSLDSLKIYFSKEVEMSLIVMKEKISFLGYTFVSPFFGDLAVAEKDGRQFHVTFDLVPAYPERYDMVWPFFDGWIGRAVARDKGRCFHLSFDGSHALPSYRARYDRVWPYFEGLAGAEKNGEHFHIRYDGSPAYIQRYDYVGPFNGPLALARKNNRSFYITTNGLRADRYLETEDDLLRE